MNRIIAFVLAVVFVFAIAFVFAFHHSERQSVFVKKVIDGDTIILGNGVHVRFLNINAPEHTTPISNLSISFMKRFQGKNISIEVTGFDKYGRTLARLYNGSEYLNLEEVKEGLASKFLVQDSELKTFADAENEAISEGKGIWKHSEYFGCIKPRVNATGEYVVLKNVCDRIDLDSWEMKDESRKTFVFPNISIPLDGSIKIYSRKGDDNQTSLFWNQSGNVWNNDRDSMYLFDSKWEIAAYESYGYAGNS